ncbi:hypothetical protein [Methylobrevis albus]|uniref:Uncharacterized protein n=1 Tax=Methylobrevis albus TaxID=2793297 RepID=A0A931I1J1_9HYPH|nr:hypothetical protein [Methylobrevis albus]MBH0238515.1 hypothetical protein [Methylobrevis albus]
MTRFALAVISTALCLISAAPLARAATEVPTQRIIGPGLDVGAGDAEGPAPFQLPPGVTRPSQEPPADEAGDDAPDVPPPTVYYGDAELPPAIASLRAELIAAAKSGDPEQLRPIIERQPEHPVFADQEAEDVIDTLKAESGDVEGREILAILLDILESGWVKIDEGTPNETYIWPYFAHYPADKLTPPQLVEVFQVMTAGDFAEIEATGVYSFYRVEIAADGRWKRFSMSE